MLSTGRERRTKEHVSRLVAHPRLPSGRHGGHREVEPGLLPLGHAPARCSVHLLNPPGHSLTTSADRLIDGSGTFQGAV